MNWIGLEEYRVRASGVRHWALCFDPHRMITDMIGRRSSLKQKPQHPKQKRRKLGLNAARDSFALSNACILLTRHGTGVVNI